MYAAIEGAKTKALKSGYSQEHGLLFPAPEGFHLKGLSILRGPEGEEKLRWEKIDKDKEEKFQLLTKAMECLADEYRGLSYVPPLPTGLLNQELTVYPIADPHFGLYAWVEESGEDFDLDIAEETMMMSIARLVACAPPTERALIAGLGDFFHTDTVDNKTARAGNVLDVDTRWAKVIRIGFKCLRQIIDMALTKHKYIDVIISIGNHDDNTAVMLAIALAAYYENNPNVNVDQTPNKFHYYEFGKNLIGITHGDTVKATMLGQIMATDMPEAWGRTKHRTWLTGHIHHRRVEELPGCTVESFNSPAAKDFWTSSHGYRAMRSMTCLVLDKDHGEIERHKVDIGQLQ